MLLMLYIYVVRNTILGFLEKEYGKSFNLNISTMRHHLVRHSLAFFIVFSEVFLKTTDFPAQTRLCIEFRAAAVY